MMRLPFLHTTASALYLTDHTLVWMTGVRMGARLRSLYGAHEPVEGENQQAALKRLVEKMQPAMPYVVAHLEPLHVRYGIIQGPPFDDPVSFEAWRHREAKRHLPPGASLSDFIVRHQLIEQTDEHTRCLLAFTRREAVEAREALLQKAGLRLLRLGSLDLAIGDVLHFNPDFAGGRSVVVIPREQEATVLHYQDGLLQTLLTLPFDRSTHGVSAVLNEVMRQVTPVPDRMFVTGPKAAEIVAHARETSLIDCPVQEGRLDWISCVGETALPPSHMPAAALALQHLFAVPEAINFLAPEVVAARHQGKEKREAMRAAAILGALMGVLYLLVASMTAVLHTRQAASDVALQQQAGLVAGLEQAEREVQQLEHQVAQAERLVGERTHVTDMLQIIGRNLPEGMWLEKVTLETDVPNAPHLTLTGAAREEHSITFYLERLEQTAFATKVRLMYAEAIQATVLYRRVEVRDQPLTRFEIQISLPAARPGPGDGEKR